MRVALIDRSLEHLVVAGVRRRTPVLHLVPARWIVLAARPQTRRLRRALSRWALALTAAIGVAAALALATPPPA